MHHPPFAQHLKFWCKATTDLAFDITGIGTARSEWCFLRSQWQAYIHVIRGVCLVPSCELPLTYDGTSRQSPAHSGDNVNCRDVGYGTVTAIIARWRPARSNYYIRFLTCFASTDRESYRPSVSCLWKYYEFVGETKRSKIQSMATACLVALR